MLLDKLTALWKGLSLAHALVIVALLGTAVFAAATNHVDQTVKALVAVAGAVAGLAGTLFLAPAKAPESPPTTVGSDSAGGDGGTK